MIYGRKIGFCGGSGGGIPSVPPEEWAYLTHCLTSDGVSPWTFTAPEKGWYRFYLIGPGGSGGKMHEMSTASDNGPTVFYPTGGGGGSGGYSVHNAYLKKGESVTASMSNFAISVQFEDTLVQVTKGGNGGNGSLNGIDDNPTAGKGGSGGTASGGNVYNIKGAAGEDGSPKHSVDAPAWESGYVHTVTIYSKPGGNGGIVSGYPYFCTQVPSIGTLGKGGDGGGRKGSSYRTSNDGTHSMIHDSWTDADPPESGCPGGIIVEKAAG